MEFNTPLHEDQPEYDLEFHNGYGPNVLDMPPSPPATPPLDDGHRHDFTRELSPFSTNSSMTSVDSQESVGASGRELRLGDGLSSTRLLSRRGRSDVCSDGTCVGHIITMSALC